MAGGAVFGMRAQRSTHHGGNMRIPHAIQIALVAITVASCGGSGGYGGPTAPGGGSTGAVGATITIRANGTVEPSEVNIQVGQRVRFVNEDGRQHQPTSNPHLSHTDCPPANLPIMNGGQSMN